jgi:disulfide bond formation protein DsbB
MPATLDSFNWPRLVPLAIMAASLGALATAYTAEYGFGLEPCPLCLYQRVPYGVTLGLGLVAFVVPSGAVRTSAVALAGAAFLVGAGLAVHHVGVERHWWASVVACGGALAPDMTVAELRAALARPPAKPCDVVDWTLFGVSMAGYNALVSILLAGAALVGAWRIRKVS